MSWTKNYTSLAQFEADYPDSGPKQSRETYDQRVHARIAARALIESGAVGHYAIEDGKDFYINMTGHANPNHEAEPGVAPDFIQINVGQIRAAT